MLNSSFLTQLLISIVFIGPYQSISNQLPEIKGVKIAFVSYRTGSAEIYLMNSNGTDLEQLTNSPENNSFPVQIDERTIAFTQRDKEGNATDKKVDIYTKEVEAFVPTPITLGAKWQTKSPNGKRTAFIRSNDYSDRELFLYDSEDNLEVRITYNQINGTPAHSINHQWSPDGTKLAFMSGPDWYNQYVRIYDLKTRKTQVITDRGYMNSGLLWVDQNTIIANIKVRDSTLYEIYSITLQDGDIKALTTNINLHPHVSPDRKWVVFESQRHGDDGEVYIMKPDGSNQIRLTDNPSYDGRCIWFEL